MEDDSQKTASSWAWHSTAPITPGPGQSTIEMFGPGAKIGRYVVLEVLGIGGMGVVFLALDPDLSRRVAIKLLHPDLARRDHRGTARARLLREAQAMARINHPNVISVHDVGTVGEQVFIAMTYVPAGTLRNWLKQPREWRDILQRFVGAGHGLAAAHRMGLIHRDFKPENVLLGENGQAMVTDFGLARDAEDARATPSDTPEVPARLVGSQLTQAGAILGTPVYMAPEQFHHNKADARSDQYSFCVALYESLYRAHPFAGGEPDQGTIPPAVRSVLLRGLSQMAEERFPTMDALLEALEHAKNQPAAKRRPRLPMMAAAAVLFGAAAAFVLFSPGPQPVTPPPRPAPLAAPTSEILLEPAPTRRDAPRVATPAKVTLAISSTPPGATVIKLPDQTELGKTPLLYQQERTQTTVQFRLELAGYEPFELALRPETDRAQHASLRKRRSKKPRGDRESGPGIGDQTYDPFRE